MPSDADRLGLALGLDGPVVVGAGQRVEPAPWALPTSRTSSSWLTVSSSATVWMPDPAQPLGGRRPDAGDHGDVHRAEQVALGAGCDDDQPVRLVEVAGDLGDELRACRSRPTPSARRSPRPPGRAAPRRTPSRSAPRGRRARRGREVDERLVERQRLDQRRDRAQQPHHVALASR